MESWKNVGQFKYFMKLCCVSEYMLRLLLDGFFSFLYTLLIAPRCTETWVQTADMLQGHLRVVYSVTSRVWWPAQ